MNEIVLHLIIRDGLNLVEDTFESIYEASNTTSLLDSRELISGIMYKISRPETIMNLGLKARLLYFIEVKNQGMRL